MNASPDTLLYLSRADVEAAGLDPGELIAAVEHAFAARGAGTAQVGPKGPVRVATGHFFQTMVGSLQDPPIAGMKFFGVVPENPARGLPNVCSIILLSDVETGLPVAVIEGNAITGARTAAVSAAGAKRLAPPDATTAAFIGCGVQAESHAVFLRHVLPGLRRALLLGRGAISRDRFAAVLRAAGWEVGLAAGPEDVLEGADVVVSSVPEYAGFRPFLDPRRVKPGAFVASVDLGRSWLRAPQGTFGLVATDDAEQNRQLVADGRIIAPGDFTADLPSMLAGTAPRRAAGDRVFFVFAGHVLGDLAAAATVYQKALARGLGTRLPR